MAAPLDVVGVGNALVDVLVQVEDDFLDRHDLVRGSMGLIDIDEAAALSAAMGTTRQSSGGSGANTLAGLAHLGGQAGFIGRIGDDELGRVFVDDLRLAGVEVPDGLRPVAGEPTGRCLIVVTPDGERTMSTLLGAAADLGPDDVDEDFVARARVTYLEGYLFDTATTGEAFAKAAAAAHRAGGMVALTLSDSFCVERFLAGFRTLVETTVDLVFGNEAEMCLLYESDHLDAALVRAEAVCDLVVVTRGAEGTVVSERGRRHHVEAEPVAAVVDTTGAGDLFAAGFLRGLTSGRDIPTCARMGSAAAAQVIGRLGARL